MPNPVSLQNQLREYLIEELAADDGSTYVKSRHIAESFDASTKQIGAALAALECDPSIPFTMQRRGGSSDGTTWYIQMT
ncbi:DUF7123 family protein [Halorubrum sp. N11]|uniref:DUF7123 family protein n=1 Tax=Halorubrum sp. N11 TaxID=3402276 RepID=UPI003EBF3D64